MRRNLPQSPRKYRIARLIGDLVPKQRRKLKEKVMETHNISKSVYYNYIGLTINDKTDIPATILKTFAEGLLVNMEDLFPSKKDKI